MKKFVIAGTLVGTLAVVGVTAYAQPYPPSSQPAPKQAPPPPAPKASPAPKGEQPTADKPAAPRKRAKKSSAATGENAAGTHTAPKPQPNTTENPNARDEALALGSVRIAKAVKADGKDLPAGTYQVRLTPDEAKPDAKGASEVLERWVEFLKGGKVVGREVVSIVPANETKLVQKDTPPPAGGSKFEQLKGGDYYRLWINKGGTYYLVHFTA